MAQYLDTKYYSKATSSGLNKRFSDLSGPCVIQGFRTFKGSGDFSLSLMRGGYKSNVAVTPSGVRVEETTDLIDLIQVSPNNNDTGEPRIDSLFLHFEYGVEDNPATYKVVPGSAGSAPENPNKLTHLLLAHVYVYPQNQTLRDRDIVPIPLGFSHLNVAGNSKFSDVATFEEEVIFEGPVTFLQGGGSEGSDNIPSVVERMGSPVIAEEGQTDINLQGDYTPGTKTLFVYKNGDLQPPNRFQEVNARLFRFHDALEAGDEIFAFWYKGLSVYRTESHNHDSLYFRKKDIIEKLPRFASDYFAGTSGREVTHNLGHRDYVILGVTPIEKATDVGVITTEKRDNSIIVYNSGEYRGLFDVSYLPKSPGVVGNGDPSQTNQSQFNVESTNFDEGAMLYRTVRYRRFDNTLYFEAVLSGKNAKGQYTRLNVKYYNESGDQVVENHEWALTYDLLGNIKNKTRVNIN